MMGSMAGFFFGLKKIFFKKSLDFFLKLHILII